jgi:hypothetical protein
LISDFYDVSFGSVGGIQMLIVALLSFLAAAGLTQISVMKTGQNNYRIEVATFEAPDGSAVASAIAQRADELCAGKEVKWGKFSSTANLGKNPGSMPPSIEGYFQEFSCVQADQRSYQPAPDGWTATAADEADVRDVFESYYRKRDRGDMEAALAMFASGVNSDPLASAAAMREFNRQLGPGKRRVVAVTWYVNPTTAQHAGIYAAVDFVGEYATAHFYCGFLGLYRRAPGSYEITREEQNIFHRGKDAADPAQVAQMRAAACRGN